MTNKKCVKAYVNDYEYEYLKRIALEHNVSVSAVITGLLYVYKGYKYYQDYNYNFTSHCWVLDPDKND